MPDEKTDNDHVASARSLMGRGLGATIQSMKGLEEASLIMRALQGDIARSPAARHELAGLSRTMIGDDQQGISDPASLHVKGGNTIREASHMFKQWREQQKTGFSMEGHDLSTETDIREVEERGPSALPGQAMINGSAPKAR